ncbi:hypothetical protein Tco_1192012 [Tanacetum coccineum]
MACFRLGSWNASFGFRGIGDGVVEVNKLNGVFVFVMPDMLRVVIVLNGSWTDGWRGALYTEGECGLGDCIREDFTVGRFYGVVEDEDCRREALVD